MNERIINLLSCHKATDQIWHMRQNTKLLEKHAIIVKFLFTSRLCPLLGVFGHRNNRPHPSKKQEVTFKLIQF